MDLTKEQVKCALTHCGGSCDGCPLKGYEGEDCIAFLVKAALGVIQSEENACAEVRAERDSLRCEANNYKMKCEQLENSGAGLPTAYEEETERDETPIGRVLDMILSRIEEEIERTVPLSREPYPRLTVFVSRLLYRFLEGMRRCSYSAVRDSNDIPRGKIFGRDLLVYEDNGLGFYVCEGKEVSFNTVG